MARIPRGLKIFDGCTTHKTWRAHNKEWILLQNLMKELYLQALRDTVNNSKILEEHILNAICIMSNHVHEVYEIGTVNSFSNLMSNHHSLFGRNYNKLAGRSGAVA